MGELLVTFCHQSLFYLTLCKNPCIWSFYIYIVPFCPISVPIGIVPGPDSIIVKPNSQAFLHCEVYGNPKPTVTWSRSREQIRPNDQYETFSNGTLLVRSATEQDVDSYTCVANNGVTGAVERTIKLSLRGMDQYIIIAQETSGCLPCIMKQMIMVFWAFLEHGFRAWLFSSPEHKVLKVTFCDGPLSVVRRPCVRACVRPSTISLTQLLLWNHSLDFDQTSQEWSLGSPQPKLFKLFQLVA